MHWRWFEPDSGVMGADEFTTTDGIDWSNVAGAFLSGSTLYFASTVDHDLYKVAFTDGEPQGAPSLADSSIDWTSLGSFVVQSTATTTGLAVTPDAQANQNEPVTMTATVSMQLDPSSHPNGTVQFDHNGTRLGSAAVDPSTGKATLTITTLPPTAPNGTVLTASFQPADSTAGGSDSAPVGYTINPVARIPHISGKVRVGNVAHCIEPTTADESSAYAWKINGKKVATGVAFRVPSGTRGKRLACTASIWIGAGPISKARSVNVTIRKRAAH
jgi:hypothetical protein